MNRFLRLLLILMPLVIGSVLHAQEKRILVMGEIVNSRDSALEGAIIRCESQQRSTVSNKKGKFALLVDQKPGIVVEFRLYGYQTLKRKLVIKDNSADTIYMKVVLTEQSIVMNEISIASGPDTVIGNWRFYIEDFEFANDSEFVLLTFTKSLKEAKLMLANSKQQILFSVDVPCEATELYKDYQGHINVLCKDSAFRVKIVPPTTVLLLALPYQDFCARILPCVDTIGRHILFSNYNRNYPAFSYFAYNPYDTTAFAIRDVIDKELLAQYNWEFDYLKPKDRLYARKMAAYTGIDPRIIAATMTGFPNSIYYTPLYAPMYVVHDTVCIFDHYSDSLYLYNRNLQAIGESKINYHHPKNWKEWDRGILKDEVTGEVYARFESGGYYTLKKIDLKTGKILGEYKIENQFVKHLRIRNGEVYYIYKPFDSLQKKFLYKERIVLS
jgi:hypothetical protein